MIILIGNVIEGYMSSRSVLISMTHVARLERKYILFIIGMISISVLYRKDMKFKIGIDIIHSINVVGFILIDTEARNSEKSYIFGCCAKA